MTSNIGCMANDEEVDGVKKITKINKTDVLGLQEGEKRREKCIAREIYTSGNEKLSHYDIVKFRK